MKIAIQLDSDRNVIGTVTTNELGAELQVKLFKDKGWTLVESNPAFLNAESDLWTVRQSDNKLVHISTGMTPSEESTQANALLGKQVGTAIAQSGTATATANSAIDIANKSVAANAELGKAIAPVLAVFQQSATNTTTGGTN